MKGNSKRKIQHMEEHQLLKRKAFLKNNLAPNRSTSNQIKYINFHLKKRGLME